MKHTRHTEPVDGEGTHRPPFFLTSFFCILIIIFCTSACQMQKKVTLALLGDFNLGRGVEAQPGSFSYLDEMLSTADLALANLESPFGDGKPADGGEYNLCAPTALAHFPADWGFDILSLVNNHANDCSSAGMAETESTLATVSLTGLTLEPEIVHINGMELVFLAFEDVASDLDEGAAIEAIRWVDSEESVVIISIHWGMEYQGAPSDRQKDLARQFAEAGADVIWGHHPHVLQPVEWVETSRGKTLVLYSLGNALFDQGGLEDTRQSALLLVTLTTDQIIEVESIPFIIDVANSMIIAPSAEDVEEISRRLNLPQP